MANRKRRRHSDEFKQEAVKLVTDQGYSVAEAARDLGLHENLLRTWKKKSETEAIDSELSEEGERCINGRLFVLIILGLFLGIFDAEVDGGSISEW